jgi:hypothetical protein
MIDQIEYYDNMRIRLEKLNSNEKLDITSWQHDRSCNLGYKRNVIKCCDKEVVNQCDNCGRSFEPSHYVCEWRPPHTPYKRLSYFKEWISKIQAKQNVDVSDDVIQRIKNEIKKSNDVYTIITFRYLLKKLNLNHLYPEAAWLLSVVYSNDLIPNFTSGIENVFYSYFHKICIIWNEVKPINRKTMLPYKYLFRKIIELEQFGDKSVFPLPSNIDKIVEYDGTWKKICLKNNWNFISSFSVMVS